ncbi:MAG: AAA family ATPase [Tannerella sp.]|jgi:ATP-dependent 26S proteasome regulatory subunit|nr:AAA family ATPase [Tannerella sp.]
MDLNLTMRFVMIYARVETTVSGMEEMHPEHLFLGLLKLPGMTAKTISAPDENNRQIEDDILKVKQIFHRAGINPESGREKLRRILFNERPEGNGKFLITDLLCKASGNTDNHELSATDLLTVILKEPTPLLRSTFSLKKTTPQAEANQAPGGIPPKESALFLTGLAGRIRNMRQALLNNVFGQDHAVHAFAEGIFNAEVLAAADKKRKRPCALFVFAGPPGVGKTFLAEQAAEQLSIPFKRFDMSSFSDHQAHSLLIGFAPSYKEAREGMLTGFVQDHPHSILLFDEIEKAHPNTIQLFLQILDAGILHDDYWDKNVSFKDTVIIFTTNAGKQLYGGNVNRNTAGFPRKAILNALEYDTHPQTGMPFFPTTICSRLATGYLIMFNHLQAHDLEKISAGELLRSCALFERQYRIKVGTDPVLPAALLLSEGGWADARTLKAQTGLFFKNEIFKLLNFWDHHFEVAFPEIESIYFDVPAENLPLPVKQLFENPPKPEILLFGNTPLTGKLKDTLPDITVHNTFDTREALEIIAGQDLNLALFEISPHHETRNFFNLVRKRIPDLPVYILIPARIPADNELLSAFLRAGAGGILTFPEDDPGLFAGEMAKIIRQTHRQSITAGFAAQHKTLSFETSPALSQDKKQVTVCLREFSIRRAVQVEDSNLLLDEIEKPEDRFDDIIGINHAKEELSIFTDYLKNPRKFTALGLKPPKGALLYGPPGTGKTLLAKAMAGESDATFIPASANALVAGCRNSGPDIIRELFNRAKRYTPAILFIDEIDAIGNSKPGYGEEMALKILLTEMERFPVDPKRPVFILAATNVEVEENSWGTETINASLVRQFDRKIRIGLPGKNDRKRYLQTVLDRRKNHRISEPFIEYLADRSMDFSLADLESVLDLSYRIAARKNIPVNDPLLEEAFNSSHPGEKKYWDHEFWKK